MFDPARSTNKLRVTLDHIKRQHVWLVDCEPTEAVDATALV